MIRKSEVGNLKPDTRKVLLFLFFFLASVFWFQVSAHAACFNPPGNAGDHTYNGAYRTLEYCNGGAWVSMNSGPVGDTRTGIVAWWKLDDGAGTSATDSSGNGNTGTLINTPTWTASGMNGGALTLNGTNQYIDVPDSSWVEITSAFTISLWFKSANTGQTNKYLVSKNGSSGGAYQWAVLYNFVSNQVEFWDDNPNGGTGADPRPGSQISVTDASWHHIVYAYDGTTWSGYKDGMQVFSVSRSFALLPMSGNHLYIGVADNNDLSTAVAGTIDDVRIYNRALSANDVMTLYTSTGGESGDINTGLIHYWKLDEASGTTASDSVGGVTATLTGTAVFTPGGGKINGALSLPDDATVKYAGVATTPADMLGQSQLTMSMWFKRAAANAIVSIAQDPNGSFNRIVMGTYNDGNFYFVLGNGSGSGGGYVASNDTNWHLATWVFDGTQPTDITRLKGYIDGGQQTLTPFGGAVPVTTPSTCCLPFYIGSETGGAMVTAGTLDDVRVYNRALSASDVLTLYNTTATACASPVGYTGDLMYNAGTYHVPQYCNGANWIPAGKVPGSGGSGCTGPAGNEGDMIYNNVFRVTQYCDGTNWVATGRNIPITGLVGWWNFDEGSGTTAADSSGNGNTGYLGGSPPPTWTTGKINGALGFDGVQNYVGTAPSASLDFAGAFSVSLWLKTTALNSSQQTIFIGNAVYPNTGWSLFDNGPYSSYVMFEILPSGSGGSCANGTPCFARNLVNDGNWHHIVGVYDGVFAMIYLDGALKNTEAGTGGFTNNTSGLSIDYPLAGSGSGTIDDVRVYNRALSASEIWRLYNGAP